MCDASVVVATAAAPSAGIDPYGVHRRMYGRTVPSQTMYDVSAPAAAAAAAAAPGAAADRWVCSRTVATAGEWDALARRDCVDGRALDEIATLDVTQLDLARVACAGVLVGVSTLRLARALEPEEVPLLAELLTQLPNLERLAFEGDLDAMEHCAAEIMLHVNLRHNPVLSTVTVAFGAGAPRARHAQTWVALLALRWPAGALALEHRIYAQGAGGGTRVHGPWAAAVHPLPMLTAPAGAAPAAFAGRMHVLRFLRAAELARRGARYARAHRDRVVVYTTTFEDFAHVEDFLRDNLEDEEDEEEDEDEEDGFESDDSDYMDVDERPGSPFLYTPE